MTINKKLLTKTALFVGLILTLIVPVSAGGMNVASAIPSDDVTKPNIGKVADGTYNEELALQRAIKLKNIHDEKLKKMEELGQKLTKSSIVAINVKQIQDQANNIKVEIDAIKQEFDELQKENQKLYYIEPETYQHYIIEKDNVWNTIDEKYWKGKSLEEKKDSFPLVQVGINHKEKAVEFTLHKDIENSAKKQQYLEVIDEMISDDVKWLITYGDYHVSNSHSCPDNRCDEFRPAIGGIEIQSDNAADGQCTLGFEATWGQWNGFVTAGHCIDGALAGNQVVDQPAGGNGLGFAILDAYVVGGTIDCDCGWVWTNDIDNAIKNRDPNPNYTPNRYDGAANQPVGTWVTMSGKTSGLSAGTIVNTDIQSTDGNNTTVRHLVQATYTSQGGDSGAPVTTLWGTSLYGINVGATGTGGIYSPVDRVISELGVSPVVG